MADADTSPAGRPVPLTIEEQHARIRAMVTALQATDDLRTADALLRELEGTLRAHFAEEERPGGLLDAFDAAEVSQARAAGSLRRDHRTIATDALAALAATRGCLDGPVAAALGQIRALCEHILQHERRESEAILDAIYAEAGGSE